jgi:hypothetical protein
MKKAVKIILLAICTLIVAFGALYFLVVKSVVKINIFPNARTLYTGYVKIEPISLSDIKVKLEAQGCRTQDYKGETVSSCRYRDVEKIPFEKKTGIAIYPYGFGWGPMSFYITEDTLWDVQDILGSPRREKFEQEVMQDISAIGGIVQIKEGSWKITELKYPWTVSY